MCFTQCIPNIDNWMTEYVRPPEQRARLIENPTVWNRFVDTTVSGLPMHNLDFLSLLASNAGRQLIPLGITYEAELWRLLGFS